MATRLTNLCRFTVRAPVVLVDDAFLVNMASAAYTRIRLGIASRGSCAPDLPGAPPTGLHGPATGSAGLAFPVTPSMSLSHDGRHGNINPLSIAYAYRPRLRPRLTLGGFTCPRKPWASGEGDSHALYRYSCRQYHSRIVQRSLRSAFNLTRDALLPRPGGLPPEHPQLRYGPYSR